jgi:hypothetical protein
MTIINLEVHLLGGRHDKEAITHMMKRCFVCKTEEATETHYLVSPSFHLPINTCVGVCLKCKQLAIRKS